MVSIAVSEAIKRLKMAGASIVFTDTGIEAVSGLGGEFKLRTALPYTDRIGSLVASDALYSALRRHIAKNRSRNV